MTDKSADVFKKPEDDDKDKKPKKAKMSLHSLAYLLLMKERLEKDPTYTVDRLNQELQDIAQAGITAVKDLKEKK